MTALKKEDILAALQNIRDEERGNDLVTLNMIKGVDIQNDTVLFSIEVDPARGPALEPLRQKAERAVAKIQGVKSVTAVLTAQKAPKPADPHGMEKNPRLELPIKHIIAVASGKGGVGKSTVALNLAAALSSTRNLDTGLLDADIYGPSVHRLTGVGVEKPAMNNGKIVPHEAHGLKIMSMGFMVEEEKAMIWRGPMVQTALYQMLRDVTWGTDEKPLDVLIVDMPPGTGDAYLTLAQKVPLAGAVIVSTPQDLSLIDARRSIEMFRKIDVPIFGLIENMSTHICSACGHEEHIFGHGGVEKDAVRLNIPFLGGIPLDQDIRKLSDSGIPFIHSDKNAQAEIFKDIAGKVADMLIKD